MGGCLGILNLKQQEVGANPGHLDDCPPSKLEATHVNLDVPSSKLELTLATQELLAACKQAVQANQPECEAPLMRQTSNGSKDDFNIWGASLERPFAQALVELAAENESAEESEPDESHLMKKYLDRLREDDDRSANSDYGSVDSVDSIEHQLRLNSMLCFKVQPRRPLNWEHLNELAKPRLLHDPWQHLIPLNFRTESHRKRKEAAGKAAELKEKQAKAVERLSTPRQRLFKLNPGEAIMHEAQKKTRKKCKSINVDKVFARVAAPKPTQQYKPTPGELLYLQKGFSNASRRVDHTYLDTLAIPRIRTARGTPPFRPSSAGAGRGIGRRYGLDS
jgi:hypothetical protein